MSRRLTAFVIAAALAVIMSAPADAARHQNNNAYKAHSVSKHKVHKVKKVRPKHQRVARHAPAVSPVICDLHGINAGCHAAVPEIGTRRHAANSPVHVPAVSYSSRPAGCPHAWCGCWLALQKYGRNVRHLWLARNWAYEGQAASKGCVGCVAVLSRGRRGGHVGIVVGWQGPNPVILSGNHNRRVGTGVYPARRLIALRSV